MALYELRTYTLRVGVMAEAVKLYHLVSPGDVISESADDFAGICT